MRRSKLLLFLGGGLFLLGVGVLWVLWSRCGVKGCPDVGVLNGYVPDEASVVLDREGGELGRLYRVNRVIVPLDSLPPYVPNAFIAVEDQRFWQHRGVDWVRVVGAAWANLRARRVEEGFSTITMQLARNVFPKRIPQAQRTLGRKLTEMRVAGQIERRFTKRQILELYLNQIYFGDGAWGIEAAAAEYFGKPASELTLGEAAVLAGVIRAPQRLSPRRNPAGARGRRGVVLEKMVEQGSITPEEARQAAEEPLRVRRGTVHDTGPAAYFVEEVRQELEEHLGETLYTGGYKIHTTLDPAVQAAAESELEAQLQAIEAGRFGAFRHPRRGAGGQSTNSDDTAAADVAGGEETRYLQGAVVVMDTESGDLLALVGGRDFKDSRFDRAVQAWRQPGSAFKPFVYGAAIAAGYPPTEFLSDTPLRVVLPDGSTWEPRNFEGSYRGDVTMRQALAQSRNVATIRLAQEVGLDRVIDFARRFGLSGPIPRVPSIAIGAAEVTLLELTTAYAALATLGDRPTPRLVTRVVDRDGEVVWSRPATSRRVVDPAVAFILTDLLRGVVDHGTGAPVRAAGFRGPAAGKTGTTNGSTDVWFMGYTPTRVAGVWIGFDRPRAIVPGATGGRLAAPVWARIMSRAGSSRGVGNGGWSPPAGVEQHWVDAAGRLYRDGCPSFGELRLEYFLAGTAPPDSCAWFGPPLLGRPYGPGAGIDSGLVPPGAARGHDSTKSDDWWDNLRRRLRRPPPDSGLGAPPDSGAAAPPDGVPLDRRSPPTRGGTIKVDSGLVRSIPDSVPPPRPPERRSPDRRPPERRRPDILGRPLPDTGSEEFRLRSG